RDYVKRIGKILANSFALVAVLPAWFALRVSQLLLGVEKGFAGWSQLFSLLPGVSGVYLRWTFYRLTLSRCGQGACISFGTVFSHCTAAVGKKVYVGAYCSIGDVNLQDDVLLSSHVSIINGCRQHGINRLDIPIREQKGQFPRVTIGRDSWIGERAVVMADVGKHCVVGAGAVVTKPLPDYAIAVGNPAKVLRYRNGQSRATREERDLLEAPVG
ncbi:MAG: acyltransferase, partial [Pirellulales bacterium]